MTDAVKQRWHEWDYKIAPGLRNIAADASYIKRLADTIGERIGRLPSRPAFFTVAEDEIDGAIKSLEGALLVLIQARLEYRTKEPVA